MKLLFVINCLNFGGAERMLVRLLATKTFADDDITVVVLQSAGNLSDELRSYGHQVTHLNVTKSLTGIFKLWRLYWLICCNKPDVIHSWLYQSDLAVGLSALLPGTRPIIWSVRQTDISLAHNQLTTIFCAKICAWFSPLLPNAIITNANASRQSHVEFGYDESKIEVIPNGIDLQRFFPDPQAKLKIRSELGLWPEDLVIGIVARHNSQKNHRAFFAAANLLCEWHPNMHFLLVGAGMEKSNPDLEAMIDSNFNASRIHLLGQRSDVASVMNALDLFMLSSSGEGWPNVVGEAMACGVPCVVTDVGDAAQIVNNTGFVVPPNDPGELANAAIKFFTLPDSQRKYLSQAARRRVEKLFDIRGVATRYRAIYEETYLSAKRCG